MLDSYRVVSQGTRLTVTDMGDEWHLTFDLERLPGQKSMEMALMHPVADEMDDWNLYQRERQLMELRGRSDPQSRMSVSLLEAIELGTPSDSDSGVPSQSYSVLQE